MSESPKPQITRKRLLLFCLGFLLAITYLSGGSILYSYEVSSSGSEGSVIYRINRFTGSVARHQSSFTTGAAWEPLE